LKNVRRMICRNCKSLLHTLEDHKDICRGSVQTYSCLCVAAKAGVKTKDEFHCYANAVCTIDRDGGSEWMALNSQYIFAHPVPDGERLNLVVHGIAELKQKIDSTLHLKIFIFCRITPCSELKIKPRLPRAFRLHSCLVYSSTIKMEASCSSETSVDFQQTTRRYISEDRTLHNHCCQNFT
jgi:hypothetical protein